MHDAPQFLVDLEQSGLAAAIRQSSWAYPAANIGHIIGLTLFAGTVAIMDARLLGALAATPLTSVMRQVRPIAFCAFLIMVITGFSLFCADASHIGINKTFHAKLVLIGLGLLNAFVVSRMLSKIQAEPTHTKQLLPRIRVCAGLSLMTWMAVAGLGRYIAYS
jgi:uncharacterized membrane protein